MNTLKTLMISSALVVGASVWAVAQDADAPFQLPEQCSTDAGMGMAEGGGHAGHGGHGGAAAAEDDAMDMGMMGMDMESLPDFQRENMEGK
jgi:hypothetical protein